MLPKYCGLLALVFFMLDASAWEERESPVTPQESAAVRQAVTDFYQAVAALKHPWELSPKRISPELHALLQLAQAVRQRYRREAAANGEPYSDADHGATLDKTLFYARPTAQPQVQGINHIRRHMGVYLADVAMRDARGKPPARWKETALVLFVDGRWRVDDVLFSTEDLRAEGSIKLRLRRRSGDNRTVTEAWIQELALAQLGDPEAQKEIANDYANMGDPQAADWWRRAAQQGDVDAQLNLAQWLHKNKADKEAFFWVEKAAQSEGPKNGFALQNLAHYYEEGIGTPSDLAAAFLWYRRAALEGELLDSVRKVAEFYAQGKGVAADIVQAYVWQRLAYRLVISVKEDSRFQQDQKRQAELHAKMTPQQLAEAETELANWTVDAWADKGKKLQYKGAPVAP